MKFVNAPDLNGVLITGAASTGNVLTATSSSAATWQAPSGGTGSKISALTAATLADLANEFAINEAGTSKKVTSAQLQTLMGVMKAQLGTNHAISSTTGTSVGLGVSSLVAGTYTFDYYLLVQTATATVSPLYGINFTGTAAVKAFWMDYADKSATLLAMTGDASASGTNALGFAARQSHNAYSTTAPNMGHTGGTANPIATTFMIKITGVVVVTATGNLELWHSSETATSTTIMAGSALICTRVS